MSGLSSRMRAGSRPSARDFYQTPPFMMRQLLEALPIKEGLILEPARGAGAIERMLVERYGAERVVAYDIQEGGDFLQETRRFSTIITNPPFACALEFIERGLKVADRRLSLLLPLDYLHGAKRYQRVFSKESPLSLAWVHVFIRRVLMTPNAPKEEKVEAGMITWA